MAVREPDRQVPLVVVRPHSQPHILDWRTYGWTSRQDGASYRWETLVDLAQEHGWILCPLGQQIDLLADKALG